MLQNEKGITLVALIVTVIVLLMLAGVSVSLVVGDNGVLTQASSAVVKNSISDAKEDLTAGLATIETIYYTKWSKNPSITRASIYDGAEDKPGTVAYEMKYRGYSLETYATSAATTPDATNLVIDAKKIKLTKDETGETYLFTFESPVAEDSGVFKIARSVTYTKDSHEYKIDV